MAKLLMCIVLLIRLSQDFSLVSAWSGIHNVALNYPQQRYIRMVSDKLDYDLLAWQRGYVSAKKESAEVIATGVPLDIEGTYFRNGHGKFEAGSDKFLHPFDGDGMVVAITIHNGTILFRNRFVQTDGYLEEQEAGKILYRGAFRAMKPGGLLGNFFQTKIKNVANTNVIYFEKKLLALWEAGRPYALLPGSLETIRGECTLDGVLSDPLQTLSVHPKLCANTKRLVSFSNKQGINSCDTTIYEFDKDFRIHSQRTISIPGFAFFHDFLVTEHYYLLLQAPVDFNIWSVILGLNPPAESMSFREDLPAKIYLVPRDSAINSHEVVEVDPHFVFHFANAYEEKREIDSAVIVFDSFRCDTLKVGLSSDSSNKGKPAWVDMDYASNIPFPLLARYRLEKKDGAWTYGKKTLSDRQLDFATISPHCVGKKHRYIYAMTGSSRTKSTPFQGYVKIDVQNCDEKEDTEIVEQVYMPQPHEFLGEPLFVSRREPQTEDDGYILSLLFDGKDEKTCTYFVMFDAKDITKGPVFKFAIKSTNLPLGLHSSFAYDLIVEDIEEVLEGFK